jgi:hypothetical protein
MSVDSGIGVVREENGPERECGDGPWNRACLLNLYAEIFANMTKMNVPAKLQTKSAQEQPRMAREDGHIEESSCRREAKIPAVNHTRDTIFCDKSGR